MSISVDGPIVIKTSLREIARMVPAIVVGIGAIVGAIHYTDRLAYQLRYAVGLGEELTAIEARVAVLEKKALTVSP